MSDDLFLIIPFIFVLILVSTFLYGAYKAKKIVLTLKEEQKENMNTSEGKFIDLFNSLPEPEKKEVMDFTKFLILKKNKSFRDNLPEDNEPLTE